MKRTIQLTVVLTIAIACGIGLKILISSSRTFESNLRHSIDVRAQVNLLEDFHSGLDSWESIQPVMSTWSYDPSGLVIPGELSFFTPSMHLADYDVETAAEVVKGFGLVFRAAKPRTYHAVKFTAHGSADATSLAVERYTVIDGATSARTQTLCPIGVQKEALCRIRLQAHGDTFTLYVRGQLVDSWSDDRLRSGGVGLFSGRGDRARIAWVRVSHHRDVTGKLCAFVSSLSRIDIQE